MIHISQDLNVENLVEEIEFSKSIIIGTYIQRCELFVEVLPLEILYDILKKHFPQIKDYIDEQIQSKAAT